MSGKKAFVIIIAVILFIAIVALGVMVYVNSNKKNHSVQRAKVESEKPKYESVLTKTREDFAEEKEYALYLYETACKAFQDCEDCAYIDDYTSTTDVSDLFSITCQGCRFTVKNGTEYYYADYSGAEEGADSLMKWSGKEEDTLFAIRSYTDISVMDYVYTEKVLRPTVEINDSGEFYVEADWSESNRVSGYPKHTEVPIFCSAQEGLFEQTEMTISLDTIKKATVDFDEVEDCFTIEFVLDEKNPETTKKTIDNLKAGLKNGEYTSIKKTYKIWSNGYFRMCNSRDVATNGGLDLKLSFRTYFKYKSADCDPSAYEYFDEVKKKALAELK